MEPIKCPSKDEWIKNMACVYIYIYIYTHTHIYIYTFTRGYSALCSVAHSCLTLCGPKDCSPLSSYVQRVFQPRILEWGAISYSEFSLKKEGKYNTCYHMDKP